ncbi:alpha/beta hydrolase [Sphingomonas sp. PB4P5]|uniref:alpha/beta hydrolase n=1 Tax=Parasphingomonas puruogangriensis TaxID=3096155 RepID=UPI002FC9D714
MTEPFMRADVRAFLASVNNASRPNSTELTAPDARAQYDVTKGIVDVPPNELAVVADIEIPGPSGRLSLRLFDARSSRPPGPVLVFLHGGNFVIGDHDTHAALCVEMAQTLDVPVVSVGYRLAPEHRWPAAPDDCEAAARWIAASGDALGRQVTGLVVAGDSAGGALAIVTAMALRDSPAVVPVLAQLCFYPLADMGRIYPSLESFSDGFLLTRAGLEWGADAYGADVTHVRASPMLGELTGMPPAVIVTSSLDPIRDQGRAYAAALIAAGVPTVFREAAGNIHAFATLRKAVPSSQGDVAGALAALRLVMALPGD